MPESIQIDFHGIDPDPQIDDLIREQIDKLTKYDARITTCRVQVSSPHQHHRKGNKYDVHLEIGLPGGPLAISRQPGDDAKHDDLELTVRDAFRAARRTLQDRARVRRGDVKRHFEPPVAEPEGAAR